MALTSSKRKDKIHSQLRANELFWRGKIVKVSDDGRNWSYRTFHTTTPGLCWCYNDTGDSGRDELITWEYADLSRLQWRKPYPADARGKVACEARVAAAADWFSATLIAIDPAATTFVVWREKSRFEPAGFVIVTDCRIEEELPEPPLSSAEKKR